MKDKVLVLACLFALIFIGAWQATVYSDCKMSGGVPVRSIGFVCIHQR